MLGGLYGDLPPPSDESNTQTTTATATATTTTSIWSSNIKMAPPTLRKPTTFTPPPSILRKPRPQQLLPDTTTPPPPPPPPPQHHHHHHHTPTLISVTEEYDPAKPNSYDDYKREQKAKSRQLEIQRELQRREEEEREREKERERERAGNVSASVAAETGEEAWRRRAGMKERDRERERDRSVSPPSGFSVGKSENEGLGVGAGGNMTAAQRMMAKMGWKEGQGLGRQEQGITTPLMAKRTDRRAGVIVNASDKKKREEKEEEEKRVVKGVSFNGPPTRVLLLRNMVGPGEVDDELEDEVASECAKYGTVTRVLIFEITEPDFPSIEAVGIFIQFERPEETTKAYIDLDGRFFGGRVVRAAFYDEDRFSKNELAPLPGEVPGF